MRYRSSQSGWKPMPASLSLYHTPLFVSLVSSHWCAGLATGTTGLAIPTVKASWQACMTAWAGWAGIWASAFNRSIWDSLTLHCLYHKGEGGGGVHNNLPWSQVMRFTTVFAGYMRDGLYLAILSLLPLPSKGLPWQAKPW